MHPFGANQGFYSERCIEITLRNNWCFHSCEPDIHKPPHSSISKYTLRTKLFCLTCFLAVTLSAALHSSGLVSAQAGHGVLSLPPPYLHSLSNTWEPQSFFPVLLNFEGEARASKTCEAYVQCNRAY